MQSRVNARDFLGIKKASTFIDAFFVTQQFIDSMRFCQLQLLQ